MTEPLVLPEVDLRDFPYMPLDVVRLRDSDLAASASAEEFRCAVLLWCASWHQIPAASLPDDDHTLAGLARCSIRKWRRCRDFVLAGRWILCDDGRFYSPDLAIHARRAWEKKIIIRRRLIRRLEMESGIWSDIRTTVFRRDAFTCQYCGATSKRLECDHVIPVSKGGRTELGNLVTACKPCNRSKGAKAPWEWRQ